MGQLEDNNLRWSTSVQLVLPSWSLSASVLPRFTLPTIQAQEHQKPESVNIYSGHSSGAFPQRRTVARAQAHAYVGLLSRLLEAGPNLGTKRNLRQVQPLRLQGDLVDGTGRGEGQSVGEPLTSSVVEASASQSEKRDTPRAQQREDGVKRHRLGYFGVKAQLNPLPQSLVRGMNYIHLKVEIIDACSSTLTTCGRRITSSIRTANLKSMSGSIGAPIRDTSFPPWRIFSVTLSNTDGGTHFSRLTRFLDGAVGTGEVDSGSLAVNSGSSSSVSSRVVRPIRWAIVILRHAQQKENKSALSMISKKTANARQKQKGEGTCRAACIYRWPHRCMRAGTIDDLIDGCTEGRERVGQLALSMTSSMDASGHYRWPHRWLHRGKGCTQHTKRDLCITCVSARRFGGKFLCRPTVVHCTN